jgi:putative transposase
MRAPSTRAWYRCRPPHGHAVDVRGYECLPATLSCEPFVQQSPLILAGWRDEPGQLRVDARLLLRAGLWDGGQVASDRNGAHRRFLRNHREVIAAMDLFVVFTVKFRLLYVLFTPPFKLREPPWTPPSCARLRPLRFIIRHGRRQIMHFNVTEHPSATWVVQQLHEAFPFDTAPKHFVFDRDSIFSAEVVRAVKSIGMKPSRTAYRSPWQNGTAERWVGCRQELLDHVVVLNEAHLRRLLREYVAYHHEDRTHCGLGKGTPLGRVVEARPSASAKVVALLRVAGLHHRYTWRDAA